MLLWRGAVVTTGKTTNCLFVGSVHHPCLAQPYVQAGFIVLTLNLD